MNEVYMNLLKTSMVIVFLLLIDFILEIVLIRKIQDKKKSLKFRVCLRYILCFCFLFFMAKIWVEGFGYLLTIIGVIAAALTITQKEYIMNFVGWLIIMWRDLFVEGDYIELGKYSGYVERLGPLFFTIQESSEFWGHRTGKVIKIPNNVVATQTVLKYRGEDHSVEGKLSFIFTFASPIEKVQALVPLIEREIENYTQQKSQCQIKIYQEKPSGIILKVRYMATKLEQKGLEDKICVLVIKEVQRDPDLGVSVAT